MEEPLPAGGSCLLGSINLAEFVDNKGVFNYSKFQETVIYAVIALNEVLAEGLPLHPLKVQQDSVQNWRQIGLGIMGLADMFIKMGITYGSEEAINFSEYISRLMMCTAIQASINLAQKNSPFPKFNYDFTMDSMLKNYVSGGVKEVIKEYGMYNSQLLTCAPTGTISTMLGVSGGIEPIFANYYTRKTESLHGHDEYYKVYTPIVEKYMKEHFITDDSQLPDFFVTAHDIKPLDRIKMQAAWQENIDASISSTINLPKETTVEEVVNLYIEAWQHGLKGLTIFRDGCARTGILTTEPSKKEEEEEKKEPLNRTLRRGEIIAVDDNLIGVKKKLMSGCGTLHCEAFFDKYDGAFREIYLSKGSTGGCNNFMVGLSRMISLAARGGINLNDIIDQLMSTGACPSYRARTVTQHDTSQGSCCPMAVAYALREMQDEILEYIIDKPRPQYSTDVQVDVQVNVPGYQSKEYCPECGEELIRANGCVQCPSCGYSKCD